MKHFNVPNYLELFHGIWITLKTVILTVNVGAESDHITRGLLQPRVFVFVFVFVLFFFSFFFSCIGRHNDVFMDFGEQPYKLLSIQNNAKWTVRSTPQFSDQTFSHLRLSSILDSLSWLIVDSNYWLCQVFLMKMVNWLILTFDHFALVVLVNAFKAQLSRLMAHNWQKWKKYSWHVPAMKFIGMKQLV